MSLTVNDHLADVIHVHLILLQGVIHVHLTLRFHMFVLKCNAYAGVIVFPLVMLGITMMNASTQAHHGDVLLDGAGELEKVRP